MANPLETYLKEMRDIRATGAAVAETSFYPALAELLNAVGDGLKPKVRCVVNIADRGAGLPDGGMFTADQFRKGGPDPMQGQMPARGVLEVKGPAEDIRRVAQSEQVRRYAEKYGVVLVANYREFLLLGRDERGNPLPTESYSLADDEASFWEAAAHPRKTAARHAGPFLEYLARAMQSTAPLASPQDVAWFLASYARDAKARVEARKDLSALASVRHALEEALGMKFEGERGDHFFRSTLVQTLFYGVFSAWALWHRENPEREDAFEWRMAQWSLRVPFIRALYQQVATPDQLGGLGLTEVLDWTAAALNRVDRAAFFQRFQEDRAVQYFYEPFLEAFDPELRKELGVWYTPPEIVQYQVARVDAALREELNLPDGLADPNVVVLDPCCGTGAYLVEVLKRIGATLEAKGEGASVASLVKQAAKTRVFGFEILPSPFVVAHLQMGLMLHELGAPLIDDVAQPPSAGRKNVAQPPSAGRKNVAQPPSAVRAAEGGTPGNPKDSQPEQAKAGSPGTVAGLRPAAQPRAAVPHTAGPERVGIYLTNALTGWEPPREPQQQVLGFLQELQQEKDAAEKVKREERILVVLGNPPYNAFAGVSPAEEQGLVEVYKAGLNTPVAKGGWGIKKFNLDDLYVRFFRLAERRIAEMTGRGVVSFISNHSWISEPSFVVLRKHLLESFEKFWIENLHGNRKISEYAPDGRTSETVFAIRGFSVGIQQGVATSLWVKSGKPRKAADVPIVLFRDDVDAAKAGDRRQQLLATLSAKRFDAAYKAAGPRKENRYSFRPEDVSGEYVSWPKLTQLCKESPINGLMEKRGGALIDTDRGSLKTRMMDYFDPGLSWEEYKLIQTALTEPQAAFEPKAAREKACETEPFKPERIVRYALRPYDTRWCYYTPVNPVWNRSRPLLWKQCFENNAFLMSRPAGVAKPEGFPFFYTRLLGDNDFLRGHAYYFPFLLARPHKERIVNGRMEKEPQGPEANLSHAAQEYLRNLCHSDTEKPSRTGNPMPETYEAKAKDVEQAKNVAQPVNVAQPPSAVRAAEGGTQGDQKGSGAEQGGAGNPDAVAGLRPAAQPRAAVPHTARAAQPGAAVPHAATAAQPGAAVPHTATAAQPGAAVPHTATAMLPISAPDLIWLHALAIGYSPAYLSENADGIRRDWPRIPLPAKREDLESSAALGRQVAALLDTEADVPGVTAGDVGPFLRTVAVPAKAGGGAWNPAAGDLAVNAGWGHGGKGGAVMPGRGRAVQRPYEDAEREALRCAAEAMGLEEGQALALLGQDTLDIYLNERAYWKNVPANVWGFFIGGYQVIKKWLSYREEKVLGRPLRPEEAREAANMARRLAQLVLMQPALDANYRKAKADAYPWPKQ